MVLPLVAARIPKELLEELDKQKGNLSYSQAIKSCLEYVLSNNYLGILVNTKS